VDERSHNKENEEKRGTWGIPQKKKAGKRDILMVGRDLRSKRSGCKENRIRVNGTRAWTKKTEKKKPQSPKGKASRQELRKKLPFQGDLPCCKDSGGGTRGARNKGN